MLGGSAAEAIAAANERRYVFVICRVGARYIDGPASPFDAKSLKIASNFLKISG
jgi:hypothetical protein